MRVTDAGIETVLLFEEGLDLPCFASFPLVDTEAGREALRRYYIPFLELARDREVGFVLSAPTWRANPDWGAQLGYDGDALDAVNRRAVAFVAALRDEVLAPFERGGVTLEACIGPRCDGYRQQLLMDAEEAERYHGAQLRALADSGCEQIAAMTLTYPEEAIGIVRAAGAVGLPAVISFTVETDGRLASGATIEHAIEAVDGATDGAARSFMLNCAHPSHFADGLPQGDSRLRIQALRANASLLSHAELDEAEALDPGDPVDLGRRYVALRGALPALDVLGGCCGTDIRHVTAICDAWLGDDDAVTRIAER